MIFFVFFFFLFEGKEESRLRGRERRNINSVYKSLNVTSISCLVMYNDILLKEYSEIIGSSFYEREPWNPEQEVLAQGHTALHRS